MTSRLVRTVTRSYATLHNSPTGKRYSFMLCDLCFSHLSAQQVCQFPCFTTLRFGLLMCVTSAIVMLNMGGPSTVCLSVSRSTPLQLQSCHCRHQSFRSQKPTT